MYIESFYNHFIDALSNEERSFSEMSAIVLRIAMLLHLEQFTYADDSVLTVDVLLSLHHSLVCADNDICNDNYLNARNNDVVASSVFFEARCMSSDTLLVVFDHEAHDFNYAYNYELIAIVDDKFCMSMLARVDRENRAARERIIIVRETLEACLYAADDFYRQNYNVSQFFEHQEFMRDYEAKEARRKASFCESYDVSKRRQDS